MSKLLDELADIKDTLDLNDYLTNESLVASTASVDAVEDPESSLSAASKMLSGEDTAQSKAATLAALASADYETTIESLKEGAKKSTQTFGGEISNDLTAENFTSASPTDVASLNYKFNYSVAKQEPLLEGFLPTIAQPIGTRTLSIKVDVDYIVNPYTRLDGVAGKTKDGAIPFVKTINQKDIYQEKNLLVPVSDRDAALDGYFIKTLEAPAKDPFNGATINSAPLKIGEVIALLDLSQSADEVANGAMDNRTNIAPNPTVSSLIIQAGGEDFELDTSNSGSLIFTESAIGDGEDIVLNASMTMELAIRDLVTISTVAQTIVTNLPTGYKVKYDVLIQGEGNIISGHVSVHANIFKPIAILDAAGVVVPTTAANYALYLADANLFSAATVTGYTLKAFLINDDLHRIGHLLTVRNKTQPYHLTPSTPISVQAPVKGLAGIKSDARYIPTLARKALVDNNYKGIATIIGFANYLRNNIPNGVADIDTIGIGRYFVTPWFKSVNMDLKNTVDSLSSSFRRDDIKATIANQLKVLIDDMLTASVYADAVEGVKETIDIAIGVHSSFAVWIGDSIDLGAGINVKVFSTRKSDFIGKIIFAPANFSSTRNQEVDVFSLGAHLYTPVLIGETIENKNRELSAQLINTHAIFCPIMGEITYTGLDTVIRKIAQYEKTVV